MYAPVTRVRRALSVGFRLASDAAGELARGKTRGQKMASLLSAHDVARTLNVTLRTAQRLLKAGSAPAFRLNARGRCSPGIIKMKTSRQAESAEAVADHC